MKKYNVSYNPSRNSICAQLPHNSSGTIAQLVLETC